MRAGVPRSRLRFSGMTYRMLPARHRWSWCHNQVGLPVVYVFPARVQCGTSNAPVAMFVSVRHKCSAVCSRRRHVVRCKKPDKSDHDSTLSKAEKEERVALAVEDLRKMQVDREAAQEIIKLWKESGVTEDPDELQKLYKEKSTGALARFGVQIFLDACACYAAYTAATAINDGGEFFGKPVLVFIFAAVTFNYGLALISNVLSLGVSIRSMNRFGTNAVAYLEAVKEIAGPTSLDSLTRVQSAIDCMKIASSLEKVDAYLKERAESTESTMQTMERLGVYFVLNRAREQQGFEPEKYGLSEADAVTIARMFTKYDTNDDGRIDQRELEQLCLDAGRDMSPQEVKAALQAIDENGNGYIEFNEFVAFWSNPQETVAAAQAAQPPKPPQDTGAAAGSKSS